MAGAPKQTDRVAVLKTPIGDDVLNAVRFDGVEGMSELFEYTIEALSERSPVDMNKIIGQNCTLILQGKTAPRRFCGVLTNATNLGASGSFYTYKLVLRPWLWLLSRTSDCRIFHEESAPDIIRKVFNERGFNDFEIITTENYPTREYCVQYRETDLNFVCRLMEEEGIYYFFKHEDNKHKLILADSISSHQKVPGLDSVKYHERIQGGHSATESIYELIINRSFQTGKYELKDYDYKKPSSAMISKAESPGGYTHDKLEIFDYPGRYTETSDGDRLAKVRLQADQAIDFRREVVGDAPALVPGGIITVKDHPESSENGDYLVTRCSHSFSMQHYRSGDESGGEGYSGSYEFQPQETPFRAPLITPAPRVMGPQTAKVVGQDGEEIDVDDMGRILVQFHWDRKKDQSRRVRVAQTLSGKAWGAVWIPRIGQEVVVDFLEADPDQPLVTGTVYNKEMTVPYTLPANKTKAGIKSNSTKGGGGYNEFVFEDKKNSEEIGLHAQKDLNVVVLDTETREIGEKFTGGGASRKTTLKKGDDEVEVKTGNQKIDVQLDQNVKAGKSITLEASASITLKVGSSKIVIDPSGVTIKGTAKVDINGGAAINAKAGIIKLN